MLFVCFHNGSEFWVWLLGSAQSMFSKVQYSRYDLFLFINLAFRNHHTFRSEIISQIHFCVWNCHTKNILYFWTWTCNLCVNLRNKNCWSYKKKSKSIVSFLKLSFLMLNKTVASGPGDKPAKICSSKTLLLTISHWWAKLLRKDKNIYSVYMFQALKLY